MRGDKETGQERTAEKGDVGQKLEEEKEGI